MGFKQLSNNAKLAFYTIERERLLIGVVAEFDVSDLADRLDIALDEAKDILEELVKNDCLDVETRDRLLIPRDEQPPPY